MRPFVVCIGGAFVDRKFHLDGSAPREASSLCGRMTSAFGGVARNVAENLARSHVRSELVSLVGDDQDGRALLDDLASHEVGTQWTQRVAGASTAQYVAVLEPTGELRTELADTAIFERFSVALLDHMRAAAGSATWVFADANLPAAVIAALARDARRASYRFALDAVSMPKAVRLPADLTGVDVVFLNVAEAGSYLAAYGSAVTGAESLAAAVRSRGARSVVVTDGPAGAVVAERSLARIPAAVAARVVDVTGAGDALVATTLARLCANDDLTTAVAAGTSAAARTIESDRSVQPNAGAVPSVR